MDQQQRITTSLLMLRISVFIVMLFWTLDKFVNPAHAGKVYETFYFLPAFSANIFIVLGVLELILISAFLIGFKKRITYGAVFFLHAVSTLSSYAKYLDPFNSLLFFAAWPMLAACFALYMLRDLDTKLTVGK